MHFRFKTLAAAMLLAAMTPAVADAQIHPAHMDGHRVTVVNDRDHTADTVDVYRLFIENAQPNASIPGAPRFAVMGSQGKFYFGIGGSGKATLSFDWGHPIDNANDFTTSAIPMRRSPGNGGLLQVSAATSSLFFNCVALPDSKNRIGVYVGFNFTGKNYGFNLTGAYMTFRGITAGYNYTLFADMAAVPVTIDYEGPGAISAVTNGVFDYVHKFGRHWTVAAGVEMPEVSATTGPGTTMVNQRVPDIPAYVQYSWNDRGSWVRLSGILRNMLYRDMTAGRNRDIAGWGVKVSGSASMCPVVRAYWQAAYGRGISNYFEDTRGLGIDMAPAAGDPSRLEAVKAWSAMGALQFSVSPTVQSSVVYSHIRDYVPDYTGGSADRAGQYSYAQYALANVIWKITPMVRCGLEYIWGRRCDMDGSKACDNRLQTMLQVSF